MRDFGQQRGFRKLGRRKRTKLVSTLATLTIFAVVFLFFSSIILFAWYAKDLPNPNKVQRKEGFSTIIYDRNGQVLYDIFAEKNRIPVKLKDIPEHLKKATVAIEDKDFYKHQGYSTRGIFRSLVQILVFRRLAGGSTLTQQLVKNVLLSQERTLPRKIKEFILAVQIERKYSKNEILKMYLNEAPYGGTAWGVESAAQTYFGKNASELNLVESAILAGLPQRPSSYSPYGEDPKAYIWRAEQVLRRMREDDYISKEEEEAAKKDLANVEFIDKGGGFKAPHFVMYVKKQLEEQFGARLVEQGGLRVTTTLDLELQEEAEKIVAEELEKVKNLQVGNGAAMVLEPQTGEILAMVGSRDYHASDFEGKFNVVTQGLRQPGSAIKPITYATAFAKGYTPASLVIDVPTEFPGGAGQEDYKPQNYDDKFRGPLQFRMTLGNSINLAAVKVLALVGVRQMLETAYNLGLTTLEPTTDNVRRFGLSITLGGGEVRLIDLSRAFGVFATGGLKQEPVFILKIEDSQGRELFKYKETSGKRVLGEDICFLISHILSDNNARLEVFGPNSWLKIPGKTVAVKTGTTDDKRDNWTVGYTKEIVVGVWVGNNDNSPMNPKLASGVTGAAPIWNRIMRVALGKFSDGIIEKPDNVIALQIDALGGGLPREGQATRSEYFIKGTEPTTSSPIYQKLKLSKNQERKLANNEEIAAGQFEEKEFLVLTEDDLVSGDGRNRWQEGIDKYLSENHPNDPLYHPPKEVSTYKVETTPTAVPTETPTSTPTGGVSPTPTNTPSLSPTPSPPL